MILPSIHAVGLLLLTPFVFYFFATGRLPMTTVALALLVGLVVLFSVFPYSDADTSFGLQEIFSSFGNEALVAICALMILGRGLLVTGALEPVTRIISRSWEISPLFTSLLAIIMCAVLSSVLNNTPLVIVMIAVISNVATRTGMSPRKLLLPMNFAALIGGMGTTIGSSTNLIVVSFARGAGFGDIGVFDFFLVTALAAGPAFLFLWLVAPRLLSTGQDTFATQSLQLFDAWLYIPADSEFIGQPLSALIEKSPRDLQVLEVKRGENDYLVRLPLLTLMDGDRLLVRDTRDNLKLISDELKLPLHDLDEGELPDYQQIPANEVINHQLAELVVSSNSDLVGSTIAGERLAERTGLIVLGLRKLRARFSTKPEEISRSIINSGDVLLVQGPQTALEAVKNRGDLLVLDGAISLPRSEKALTAIAIMAAVVLLASTQVIPISIAAMTGVLAMLLTTCIKWEDVGQSLSSEIVLIIAASLALGNALTVTGAADYFARGYVFLVSFLPPAVVLSSLMLMVGILTNFVSNSAAAAVGTPVALSVSAQLGVSPEPFILAVLFGANLCFLTPMGYQTNLLVMGAAQYRFRDFIRTGTPIFLIMWGMYSWLLPRFFPL